MKTKKQIEAETFIIEAMPKIQKDLLAIVVNVFESNPKFSKAQLETPYTLPKDILCLGLEWLANQYGPSSLTSVRDKNKLKKYVGTFRE